MERKRKVKKIINFSIRKDIAKLFKMKFWIILLTFYLFGKISKKNIENRQNPSKNLGIIMVRLERIPKFWGEQ